MKVSTIAPLAAFALGAFALPSNHETRAAPTIYFAGDSTMAAKGANDGATDGNYCSLFPAFCITDHGKVGVNTSPSISQPLW